MLPRLVPRTSNPPRTRSLPHLLGILRPVQVRTAAYLLLCKLYGRSTVFLCGTVFGYVPSLLGQSYRWRHVEGFCVAGDYRYVIHVIALPTRVWKSA